MCISCLMLRSKRICPPSRPPGSRNGIGSTQLYNSRVFLDLGHCFLFPTCLPLWARAVGDRSGLRPSLTFCDEPVLCGQQRLPVLHRLHSLLLQQRMNLVVNKRKRVYATLVIASGCLYLINVRVLHLPTDLARACEIVQGTYHPVLRSHRHHDSVALFVGRSFACAIACHASRWLRMSSIALFNSFKLSSARMIW